MPAIIGNFFSMYSKWSQLLLLAAASGMFDRACSSPARRANAVRDIVTTDSFVQLPVQVEAFPREQWQRGSARIKRAPIPMSTPLKGMKDTEGRQSTVNGDGTAGVRKTQGMLNISSRVLYLDR